MRIRWDNIFGLMLVIFLIYLFVRLKPFLERKFEDLSYVRYGNRFDPVTEILVIGILCFTVIAVVQIINRNR